MNRRKVYLVVIAVLALLLTSVLTACAEKEVPYAPDFTLPTLDGGNITLSDFHGKPVMLTFWSINCPACQFQMPYLQALYSERSNEQLALLTINVGDNPILVQEYVTNGGLTFPVLLDLKLRAARAYGIPGVPVTFFIDGEGIVQAYKLGPFESQAQMEKALAELFPSLIFTPEPKAAPDIGSIAPDFTLRTIYSQIITLSTLRGKTVLLNFWVSTCSACVDELSYLQAVADKRSDEELTILAINVGETDMKVVTIVDSQALTFPMLLDTDGDVCTAYGRGNPATFLIDGNGVIRAIKDDTFESPDAVESLLDSLQ